MPVSKKLIVSVGNDDVPQHIRDQLGRALQQEIQQLSFIEDVEPIKHEVPAGARAGYETILWDGLVVGIVQAALAISVTELCTFLRNWSKRPGGQSTKLKIQEGDRIIEKEFDPASMTPAEIEDLARRLRASLQD